MTDADGQDDTTPRRRTASASTKRATGESSIYQDEDGRWHGFVSMGKKENGIAGTSPAPDVVTWWPRCAL